MPRLIPWIGKKQTAPDDGAEGGIAETLVVVGLMVLLLVVLGALLYFVFTG